MRGEVIERLDGELRMERIETTRLIGGSLRALQDEARRLGIGLRVPEPLVEPSLSAWEPGSDRAELPAADLTGYPTDSVPTPATPATPATPPPSGLHRPAQPYSALPSYTEPVAYPSSPTTGGDPAYGGYPASAGPAYPTAPPPAPSQRTPPQPGPGPLDAYLATDQPPPSGRSDELGPILAGPLPEQPLPPIPRGPQAGESVPRHRRARSVMSRLLGR
jgi:hypothetical protein